MVEFVDSLGQENTGPGAYREGRGSVNSNIIPQED